ncbi:tetratricopeptide repeat protein [Candidatus Riflebacteria bacterium]
MKDFKAGRFFRVFFFFVVIQFTGVLLTNPYYACCQEESQEQFDSVAKSTSGQKVLAELEILYPGDGSVFPPEFIPPTIRWEDNRSILNAWKIKFSFQDSKGDLSFKSSTTNWSPSPANWEKIKSRSLEKKTSITIEGYKKGDEARIYTKGIISISISKDEVGAPIFYREVNIPFIEAVQDPAKYIRWRFGTIDSLKGPPVVLEKIPTCANCHSFSMDGKTLAMEIDSANDKGSYVISPIAEEMVFDKQKVITWSDYKREEGDRTFGLLAQISPDGKYVVCTVKDRSVFIARPDLTISQLFFPIKGILCYYNRESKTFHALPGADNRELVQSNPSWSPDGKYLIFARTRAYTGALKTKANSPLLSPEKDEKLLKNILDEFKDWKFDLYRIPFNNGKGGEAVPLKGASANGMSNYFAKYSPDGKWIIFCKAKNFMLLQPDSELYIIPASGGKARRLRCNTKFMNSWHSWSPNSRWLVFSSKANGPHTQLFLTHIDEEGRSTPPVVLENFTAKNMAANIPEFVFTKPDAIKKIQQKFLDFESFMRAAWGLIIFGNQEDLDGAEKLFNQAKKMEPQKTLAHHGLGVVSFRKKKVGEAENHYKKAIELDPNNAESYNGLAMIMSVKGDKAKAEEFYYKALSIASHPNALSKKSRSGVYFNLGLLYLSNNKLNSAQENLLESLKLQPEFSPLVHFNLAKVFARQRDFENAISHLKKGLDFKVERKGKLQLASEIHFFLGGIFLYEKNDLALALKHYQESIPNHPRPAAVYNSMGIAYARQGNMPEAVKCWRKALSIEPGNMAARRNLAYVPPAFLY